MTCIVGLEHEGKVYLGGDSAGIETDGTYSRNIRTQPKVFRNGEFIMGYTSSFRMGQLLQYALKPPKQKPTQDDMEYLVVTFVDALIKTYEEKGYLSESVGDSSSGEYYGGIFLLGYKSKLYHIDIDFQVAHCAEGYTACGSGGAVALGSLHATNAFNETLRMDPTMRLKAALDAAVHFNAGVAAPYTFVTL